MSVLLNPSDYPKPWVIAHRGYSGKYPENTLIAFDAALKTGVEMIELDVTLSLDRKLIVIHDSTIDRTTNGQGRVQEKTWAQLKQLDAGSWYHPRFRQERLPTLAEVFALVREVTAINVEIKSEAYESNPAQDAIESQVCTLIQEWHLEDSILISSFQHDFLRRIKNHYPHLHTALLYSPEEHPQSPEILCKACPALAFNPDIKYLSLQEVRTLHQQGLLLFPYTVNEPSLMRQCIEWGVDGMFTNEPELLQDIRTESQSTTHLGQ
ncbi:glycerophosphodiester phosphodiesterase [Deltaproteobacteria bacterium TL4]